MVLVSDSGSPSAMQSIGLYIHVPFCETKCSYCNFNTYARLEGLIPGYIEALASEIEAWGETLGHPPVGTVFFGGGTPSWLPAGQTERIMAAVRRAFDLSPNAEVTAEANPGDIAPERMSAWRQMGINRISIGVQSFDDGLLTLLTRRHSAEQAIEAVSGARAAGYDNLSVDLMYGLPRQSLSTWRSTLEKAIRLRPPHLSLYALTIEEGTPMHRELEEGAVSLPDPDLAADMYNLAEETLASAGYGHYEISNWALPGAECLHNLTYWKNGPFLGVGPGAHSYLDGERFWNIKSPTEYVQRMTEAAKSRDGQPWDRSSFPVVESREKLTEAEILSETLILNLRLDQGLETTQVLDRFGLDALRPHIETLRWCASEGLVTEEAGVFRLTPRGRLLSNEVFVRLLAQ